MSPFPQSILAYAPMWPELSKKYNLFAYDMPGFGLSDGGYEYMTFKAQGEFLNTILGHFNISDAYIVSPDVGMPAIVYYAGTYGDRAKGIMFGDGPAVSPSENGSVINKMVYSRFWRLVFRVAGSGALIEAGKRICNVNYHPNEIEMSEYKKAYHIEWVRY